MVPQTTVMARTFTPSRGSSGAIAERTVPRGKYYSLIDIRPHLSSSTMLRMQRQQHIIPKMTAQFPHCLQPTIQKITLIILFQSTTFACAEREHILGIRILISA